MSATTFVIRKGGTGKKMAREKQTAEDVSGTRPWKKAFSGGEKSQPGFNL